MCELLQEPLKVLQELQKLAIEDEKASATVQQLWVFGEKSYANDLINICQDIDEYIKLRDDSEVRIDRIFSRNELSISAQEQKAASRY